MQTFVDANRTLRFYKSDVGVHFNLLGNKSAGLVCSPLGDLDQTATVREPLLSVSHPDRTPQSHHPKCVVGIEWIRTLLALLENLDLDPRNEGIMKQVCPSAGVVDGAALFDAGQKTYVAKFAVKNRHGVYGDDAANACFTHDMEMGVEREASR